MLASSPPTWSLRALLVALLAALPAALAYNLPYVTIIEKSVAGYKPTSSSSFSIPSEQCSGYIDESLVCGAGGVAGALRVEVHDGTSFPAVRIDQRLRNVTVLRAKDAWGACAGQAEVDMFVGCLVAPKNARRRRAAGALPAAAFH